MSGLFPRYEEIGRAMIHVAKHGAPSSEDA